MRTCFEQDLVVSEEQLPLCTWPLQMPPSVLTLLSLLCERSWLSQCLWIFNGTFAFPG